MDDDPGKYRRMIGQMAEIHKALYAYQRILVGRHNSIGIYMAETAEISPQVWEESLQIEQDLAACNQLLNSINRSV